MGLRRKLISLFGAVAVTAAIPFTFAAPPQDFAQDEEAWRTQHIADLKKPDGWLSLVALEWLQPGDTSMGSAADNQVRLPPSAPAHVAILRLANDTVSLVPPQNGFPAGLLIDGVPPSKEQALRADPDKDKFNSRVTFGTMHFYVIRRADEWAVRVKDARAPTLTGFEGLHWFDADPTFRVTAKWTPYVPLKTATLARMVGKSYSLPMPGVAEFTLQQKTFRIEPVLEDPKTPKLFFILRDTTSMDSTYPACRFLYTGFPDHGIDQPGELVLDFNHLENPPCAYTAYATCPLPPPGNRLPIALPAGEKRYHN